MLTEPLLEQTHCLANVTDFTPRTVYLIDNVFSGAFWVQGGFKAVMSKTKQSSARTPWSVLCSPATENITHCAVCGSRVADVCRRRRAKACVLYSLF